MKPAERTEAFEQEHDQGDNVDEEEHENPKSGSERLKERAKVGHWRLFAH